MKRKTKELVKFIVLICFSLVLFSNINAEEKETQNSDVHNSSGWLSLGFGKCYFGPTFNIGISYAYNNNIFSLRYLKAEELQISFGEAVKFNSPPLNFKEIGILYGRYFRGEPVLVSLSGGICFIEGTDRGKQIAEKEFERKNISTLGIPFEGEMRFELCRYIGIGVSIFGNLNIRRSFFGGMLKLSLGKL